MKLEKLYANCTPNRQGKGNRVEVFEVRIKLHGVIPIKIYFKRLGNDCYWLVEGRSGGKRRLLNSRSHEAAHQRAKEIADAIAWGRQAVAVEPSRPRQL